MRLPLWLTTCATLAIALSIPTVAGATLAGRNGAIAFVSEGDIWVVEPDGSGLRRVTTDPTAESSPAWSPDGSTIAFERGGDIVTIRPDATGGRVIVGTPLPEAQPSWSPDGREIAFIRTTVPIVDECDDEVRDVYAARVDGSGERRLTRRLNLGDPAWSPDGRRIAVTSRSPSVCDEPNFLSLVDVESGSVAPLFAGQPPIDSDADWSPDGRSLAFTRNEPSCTAQIGCVFSQEIAVGSRNGARSSLLTRVSQADTEATWSPDGQMIAFVTLREALTSDAPATLYLMGASGADPRPLRAGLQGEQPAWQPLPPPAPPAPVATFPGFPPGAEPSLPPPDPVRRGRLRATVSFSTTRVRAGRVLRIRVTLSRSVLGLPVQLQRTVGGRWVGSAIRRVGGTTFVLRTRPSTPAVREFRVRLGRALTRSVTVLISARSR